MSKKYLCYDVKGIQSFIFKIPKLKYIIGGSALIDQFDKETIPDLADKSCEHIFSGGGKGTFLCDEAHLDDLKEKIKVKAHNIGLDIRFGQDKDFSQASQHADELYSYVPDMNDGYPCEVSGLYPVENGKEHPVIKKRVYQKGEKIFRYFEKKLLKDILIPGIDNEHVSFFHNVKADDGADGKAGAKALGNRNRWAIISMDGNDMGMQFRHQVSKGNPNKLEGKALQEWIKAMSKALDNCSSSAASAGIQKVVSEWAGSNEGKKIIAEGGEIVLPIRPLVVGGDDIVVLCHSSYAMTFVEETIRVWEETSKKTPELWPATKGKLTITAGVLYASVTLPLHTAIPYSETLLASAKSRGRKENEGKKDVASPACIDWEQVTDSIIDTPAAKRQRELIFKDDDKDISRIVKLTQRPYTFEEYKKVVALRKKYGKIPATTRHKILPALADKSYAERLGFYAEIKKNYSDTIWSDLSEFKEDFGKSWKMGKGDDGIEEQSTNIIDALMLLEEDSRMEKETN